MINIIQNIIKKIKNLNSSVDNYKQDTIIQSLPNVAYFNQAKKFIEKNDFKNAKEYLYKAIELSGNDSRSYKYLGKIFEKEMNYEQAVKYYKTSADIYSQDKEIWLRLGICQINIKEYEQAIKSFEKADKITPMNSEVFTGWGMALMQLKKYALARDKFILASQVSRYNYTAILLSAVMEIRLGEYKTAEEKLKFLVKVAPNEASCYEYANLKLIQQDYENAEKYAIQTLQHNKFMLPAYFILAEVYSIDKNYEKIDEIFNLAIQNGLDCDNLHFEWGKGLLRNFYFDEAKMHFTIAIEKNINHKNAQLGLTLIDALENNFELLEKFKEQNMDSPYIQEAIGLKLLYEHKISEAIDMFKKAYQTDNKQTYNLLHIARAYKLLNNNEKVREYYENFAKLNPKYKLGLVEYSKWLMEISDYADAKRKLQKIENIDENDFEIKNMLFYCQYRLVKEKISEYNLKETISIAESIIQNGEFKYPEEKEELENILKRIQEKTN